MTRFIVDAQLPPALARWLAANGHEAEHVYDFGGDGTTDSEIWNRARDLGAVILTKDEDFPLRALRDSSSPRIVWVRVGNTRRAALLDWFEELMPQLLAALGRGERVVEIA
jgi:predicted nuclease of predicted toxin-antitoxin system